MPGFPVAGDDVHRAGARGGVIVSVRRLALAHRATAVPCVRLQRRGVRVAIQIHLSRKSHSRNCSIHFKANTIRAAQKSKVHFVKLQTSRVGALAALLIALPVAAFAAPQVVSTLRAEQIVAGPQGESEKPAATAAPGDVLQYRATYSNRGDSAAAGLVARLPVPAGTALIAQGMQPEHASGSLDGVHFAPMPLMREVKDKNGTTHREAVPLSEIKALSWNLGVLEPGKEKSVQLRVQVNAPVNVSTSEN